MKKNWWKILTVLILAYVLISTFSTPLVPGGLGVSVTELKRGKQTIEFTGYNTHFLEQGANLQCFVAVGSQYLGVENIQIKDNQHVQFDIQWPDTLPSSAIAFYVNDNVDGSVYVSTALINKEIAIISNAPLKNAIQPHVINDDHQVWGFPFSAHII